MQEAGALQASDCIVLGPEASKAYMAVRPAPLGASGGKVGSAEYRVLLCHGHVERAEIPGGERLADSDELVKKASFPRLFPPDSDAKLVLHGEVNRVAGTASLR